MNSQSYLFESHAVLWESDGSVHDLGNFGGTGGFAGNHACALNNRGQVVGHSDLKGDATTYAFLWSRETGMQPLKPLSGDFASLAIGVNDGGDAVGSSFDTSFVFRATLWRNGVAADLNSLIPGGSPIYLQLAFSINSSGEIVGFGQTVTARFTGFWRRRMARGTTRRMAGTLPAWFPPNTYGNCCCGGLGFVSGRVVEHVQKFA